jgi:hypothetical protein
MVNLQRTAIIFQRIGFADRVTDVLKRSDDENILEICSKILSNLAGTTARAPTTKYWNFGNLQVKTNETNFCQVGVG